MKEAKSKPPATTQELLGLHWSLTLESLTVSPGEKRLHKISQAISQHLSSGTLSPDEAGTLAGRLNFACSWVFGFVGKALLKPLYTRQHRVGQGSDLLNPPLRVALECLARLIPALKPRVFPLKRGPSEPLCVLYADAFITLADSTRTANRWI
jgi:hypothetical protein